MISAWETYVLEVTFKGAAFKPLLRLVVLIFSNNSSQFWHFCPKPALKTLRKPAPLPRQDTNTGSWAAPGQRTRVRRQYLHFPCETWSPVSWITHHWKTLQNPPAWWEPLVFLAFPLLCWLCLPAPAGNHCKCQQQKCTNSVKPTWTFSSKNCRLCNKCLWSLMISPALPLTQPGPVSLKVTGALSQATLPRNKLARSLDFVFKPQIPRTLLSGQLEGGRAAFRPFTRSRVSLFHTSLRVQLLTNQTFMLWIGFLRSMMGSAVIKPSPSVCSVGGTCRGRCCLQQAPGPLPLVLF